MSKIGQTGRQSQRFAQGRHSRLHVSAGNADDTTLDFAASEDADVVQRAITMPALSEVAVTANTDTDQTSDQAEITPEDVAERVYTMLLTEARRQRERWIGR